MDESGISEWQENLSFFSSQIYQDLKKFLSAELDEGKTILPGMKNVFNAYRYTPFSKTRVVIVGQDPYPNPQHAHGLCFSIPKTTEDIPKSLKNIFKELKEDTGDTCSSGNLEHWSEQGVLLMNRVLTVEQGQSNSHRRKGWEELTRETIQVLSERKENLVFLLWGNAAKKVKKWIDENKHCIIESSHPSPLSAYRGFHGSKCFSRTNEYLESNDVAPINWSDL